MKYLIGWRISEVQSHNTYETSPFRILKALFRRDGQLHLACAQLRARSDVARMHLLPRRFVISSQEQTGLLNKLRNHLRRFKNLIDSTRRKGWNFGQEHRGFNILKGSPFPDFIICFRAFWQGQAAQSLALKCQACAARAAVGCYYCTVVCAAPACVSPRRTLLRARARHVLQERLSDVTHQLAYRHAELAAVQAPAVVSVEDLPARPMGS